MASTVFRQLWVPTADANVTNARRMVSNPIVRKWLTGKANQDIVASLRTEEVKFRASPCEELKPVWDTGAQMSTLRTITAEQLTITFGAELALSTIRAVNVHGCGYSAWITKIIMCTSFLPVNDTNRNTSTISDDLLEVKSPLMIWSDLARNSNALNENHIEKPPRTDHHIEGLEVLTHAYGRTI